MKRLMKVLPLSALLFSSAAFAEPKDLPREEIEPPVVTQEELEEQGMYYWASKPVQCSGGPTVVELMKNNNEDPRVWMEGVTGMPDGRISESKFVIAVNPNAKPTTWTLIEFTDGGSQGCILGFGQGNINIGISPPQLGTSISYGQVH